MATPKYEVIASHFRGQITRGELAPGAALPSERETAETWKVSRNTVSAAFDLLASEELVTLIQGTGTVVRERLPLHRTERDRYETAVKTGLVYPAGEHARILSAELAPADADVAAVLGIAAGEQAIRRERVTYEGETAVAYSISWFPAELADSCPRLLVADRIREGTTRYVELTAGRKPADGERRWQARLATDAEIGLLGLQDPAAVSEARSVLWDEEGRVVEHGVSVAPSGRWSVNERYTLGS
jgi:GntR family transcriptional regulator